MTWTYVLFLNLDPFVSEASRALSVVACYDFESESVNAATITILQDWVGWEMLTVMLGNPRRANDRVHAKGVVFSTAPS